MDSILCTMILNGFFHFIKVSKVGMRDLTVFNVSAKLGRILSFRVEELLDLI